LPCTTRVCSVKRCPAASHVSGSEPYQVLLTMHDKTVGPEI